MIEVQVKTITAGTWPLGIKGTVSALSDREWYVFVRLGPFPERPRTWVVPRDHVAAATWIGHMSWLGDPSARPGSRNAGIASARLGDNAFARYEDRWDLLEASAYEAPSYWTHGCSTGSTIPRLDSLKDIAGVIVGPSSRRLTASPAPAKKQRATLTGCSAPGTGAKGRPDDPGQLRL